MHVPRLFRAWMLLPAALAGVGYAQPAQTPGIAVLARIEPGEFQLKDLAGAPVRTECIGDPASLIQVRHPGLVCSRFVIDNRDRMATIHYTCPGAGHGRTSIKVGADRVVRIDSQGIADNSPFNFSIEARRTGACQSAATAIR